MTTFSPRHYLTIEEASYDYYMDAHTDSVLVQNGIDSDLFGWIGDLPIFCFYRFNAATDCMICEPDIDRFNADNEASV